jgi:protein ImuB
MLWLALRLPLLPVEIFTRSAPASGLFAVAASASTYADIIVCNRKAHDRGVRAGMPVAAASALAADLNVRVRDSAAERAALERIATGSIQFTPTVSIASTEVLLEISGSLKLFGGLNRLWTRIERELDLQGYARSLACAPTPMAAQLFARAGWPVRIQHYDALRTSLAQLSVDVLELPPESQGLLRDIGVRTIGACLLLPRAELARRLGPELSDSIDRALGHAPDPRPPFNPPASFTAALPLPAPVDTAVGLLFAARRLLAEFCGFLAATGEGAQCLHFRIAHEGLHETAFDLDLAAATRDLEHLITVLRERLERVSLPAPAVAISIESKLTLPLASRNLTLLPDAREQAETIVRLIERLRARLGTETVQGLDTVADYRPEYAWRVSEPGTGSQGSWLPLSRPLWILDAPRLLGDPPHLEGPLALIAGPERIESGWWDGNDVQREYFIARNPAQSFLWIYRECHKGGRWYLHGFFA